jgi:hypothetical protein
VCQIGWYRPTADDTSFLNPRRLDQAKQVDEQNKTTPEVNHCYHCNIGAICTLAPVLSTAKSSLRPCCRPKRKEGCLQAFARSFTATNATLGDATSSKSRLGKLGVAKLDLVPLLAMGLLKELVSGTGRYSPLGCRVTQRLCALKGGHLGVSEVRHGI